MFLDTVLSQTAYAYDALASIAYAETGRQRFLTLCTQVSALRHAAASTIMSKNYEIDFDRFVLINSSYDVCIDNIFSNDEKLLEVLKLKINEIKDYHIQYDYEYIHEHIYVTYNLMRSCDDFFKGRKGVNLYSCAYICLDCGWTNDEIVPECKWCKSKAVERIDMI